MNFYELKEWYIKLISDYYIKDYEEFDNYLTSKHCITYLQAFDVLQIKDINNNIHIVSDYDEFKKALHGWIEQYYLI